MYSGKLVFNQVMDHFPIHTLHRCAQRHGGNCRVRSFPCLDQFLCLAPAQISGRLSVRDLAICLCAQPIKLYDLGICVGIPHTTLADACERRDSRIWRDFAHALIRIARPL